MAEYYKKLFLKCLYTFRKDNNTKFACQLA